MPFHEVIQRPSSFHLEIPSSLRAMLSNIVVSSLHVAIEHLKRDVLLNRSVLKMRNHVDFENSMMKIM